MPDPLIPTRAVIISSLNVRAGIPELINDQSIADLPSSCAIITYAATSHCFLTCSLDNGLMVRLGFLGI
jgi:hypothetical protein